MDFLNTLQPWHWLIVAFLCLALEAMGTGGFLLGSAAAGFLMALLLWLLPETGWAMQLAIFGLFSLVCTLAYWKFFRKVNERSDHPELNNRASQLVGRIFELEVDLANGQGRVQIGDTLWKVQSSEPLDKGTSVKVAGCDGMTLILQKNN